MSSAEFQKNVEKLLDFIATKQQCLERRQSDNEGQGTDCSRAVHLFCIGENANPSSSSFEYLAKTSWMLQSFEGARYTGIFGIKDLVRSEHATWCFHEQFCLKSIGGPWSSEEYEDVGRGMY